MRIVFMGTPEFAVASLEALIASGKDVVGVVTAPDRPAGRGRKLKASAVKEAALRHQLPVLQPEKLKSPEFLEALQALNADIQVVVAFRMLPEVVWRMPAHGTFNLHGSLLPEYRGAAPIHWAVINGDTQTGVTTFFIDEKIDTGAIIDQRKMAIGPEDTTGQVHDRMMELGAELVVDTVTAIETGQVQSMAQPKDKTFTPAPKLNANNTRIDWSLPGKYIYNKVRGLNPFPGAWTELANGPEVLSVKIYRSGFSEDEHEMTPGSLLVGKKSIKVAVQDGWIDLLELKLPGKKSLAVSDLLNGYKIEEGAKVQ